jgi:uncharacterized protein (DUF779 family)
MSTIEATANVSIDGTALRNPTPQRILNHTELAEEAPIMSATIRATPEACKALARAKTEHGPLIFHTSGGRVGGRSFPICLPKDALRLGARDHYLGDVEGVPVYDMEDRQGFDGRQGAFILDVAPGAPIGFSIEAAPGMRFTLYAEDASCER